MSTTILRRLSKVKRKLPFDSSFKNGGFVFKHTEQYLVAVYMDPVLEKEYNKPAKSQGTIIGFTTSKEVVSKSRFTTFGRSLRYER